MHAVRRQILEILKETGGATVAEGDSNTVILAKVAFIAPRLGSHWVLLELGRPTTTEEGEDDNMRLDINGQYHGRRTDGGQGDLSIRFYGIDA